MLILITDFAAFRSQEYVLYNKTINTTIQQPNTSISSVIQWKTLENLFFNIIPISLITKIIK